MDDSELVLLGNIRPGETVNISTKEIVVHRSWYATSSRWWNSESRSSLPEWIENILHREVTSYSKMIRTDLMDQQRDKILLAISGVRNLCLTYAGDPISTRLSLAISRAEQTMFKINHPATKNIVIYKNSTDQLLLPYPSTY